MTELNKLNTEVEQLATFVWPVNDRNSLNSKDLEAQSFGEKN